MVSHDCVRPAYFERHPERDENACQCQGTHAGRWKGTNVAAKVLKHGVAGEVSNVAVARERMIGLASVHPNVVR
jgi:hypothetical protein